MEEADQFAALAVGQTAERLGVRDRAVGEDPPGLDRADLRDRQRRSRTRAVRSQAGGSARIGASSIVPEASSFLSVALALRTSFACSSPRRRCSFDLVGTRAPLPPAATRAILEQRQAAVKRASRGDQSSSPRYPVLPLGRTRLRRQSLAPVRRSHLRRSPKGGMAGDPVSRRAWASTRGAFRLLGSSRRAGVV